jgi:hypothetical protein
MLHLTADESDKDIVIRKGKDDFRFYPLSAKAMSWVRSDPTLVLTEVGGQQCLVCATRAAVRILIDDALGRGLNIAGEHVL